MQIAQGLVATDMRAFVLGSVLLLPPLALACGDQNAGPHPTSSVSPATRSHADGVATATRTGSPTITSNVTVTVASTVVTQPTTLSTTQTGATPPPQALMLSVMTDKTQYAAGEHATVTIRNAGDVSVFATSGRTFCTIIGVQRQTNGTWLEVGGCTTSQPPGTVEIKPGVPLTFTLDPSATGNAELGPGTYRLELGVAVGSRTGPTATVYSSEYVVDK
jgi:hypothetical protein